MGNFINGSTDKDKVLAPSILLNLSLEIWKYEISKFLTIDDKRILRLTHRFFREKVLIYPIFIISIPIEHYKQQFYKNYDKLISYEHIYSLFTDSRRLFKSYDLPLKLKILQIDN